MRCRYIHPLALRTRWVPSLGPRRGVSPGAVAATELLFVQLQGLQRRSGFCGNCAGGNPAVEDGEFLCFRSGCQRLFQYTRQLRPILPHPESLAVAFRIIAGCHLKVGNAVFACEVDVDAQHAHISVSLPESDLLSPSRASSPGLPLWGMFLRTRWEVGCASTRATRLPDRSSAPRISVLSALLIMTSGVGYIDTGKLKEFVPFRSLNRRGDHIQGVLPSPRRICGPVQTGDGLHVDTEAFSEQADENSRSHPRYIPSDREPL